MMETYILKNHKPVREPDMKKWGAWMEPTFDNLEHRHVASDHLKKGWLSTVFLGIDHSWGLGDRPVLFETAWFPKKGSVEILDRYCTWDEAEEGHKKFLSEKGGDKSESRSGKPL